MNKINFQSKTSLADFIFVKDTNFITGETANRVGNCKPVGQYLGTRSQLMGS